jgi:hypothetical protein
VVADIVVTILPERFEDCQQLWSLIYLGSRGGALDRALPG